MVRGQFLNLTDQAPFAAGDEFPMPAGRAGLAAALLAMSLVMPTAASAQSGALDPTPSGQSGTIGGAAPVASDLCVEVDIAGYKAGHLDCATRRLQQATRDAQARAANAETSEAPSARSADVVTGVANETATRQRMGDTFGTGVRPQRPPAPTYAPPIGQWP